MAPSESENDPVLLVVFYRTRTGNEPVREWLKSLKREDRKRIGEDIKTAQFGWPLGMPLIRKLEPGLWEVRSRISMGIAPSYFYGRESDDGVVKRLHQEIAEDSNWRVEYGATTFGIFA